jgi:hypothetical protein
MKYLKLTTIIIALFMLGCAGNNKPKPPADSTKAPKLPEASNAKNNDKKEIQSLIRNMLMIGESHWIDLVPLLTDSKDSLHVGFDLKKLKTNLEELKTTNYFSAEFIDNYNKIILTLDKEMKDRKFSPWSTGELPPFNFANDVDPWCDCQDVPYDKPTPWYLVEVGVINLNNEKGELYWKWGKLGVDVSQDWRDFRYKFKVKKEDGKWKISYLQGFDFDDSIKI